MSISSGFKSIEHDLKKAKVIDGNTHKKIAIMSDCHRGIGNWSDNFIPNRTLYSAALNYYYENNYTYIELGDGDELWENHSFKDVYTLYKEIFSLFIQFKLKDRLFIVYGNHDRIKEHMHFSSKVMNMDISFYPSIELVGPAHVYMLHGHQGDLINDVLWKGTRFFVKHIWKPMELLGFKDPTGAATNYTHRKTSEKRLENWSNVTDQYLIAGHTHRPTLSANSKYINCGSCVHPEAITSVEIIENNIYLVKWSTCSRADMSLYVCREVISSTTL